MSSPERIADIILNGGIIDFARPALLREFLRLHWNDIFGAIASEIEFVKLDGGTLLVSSTNSAVRDFVKYGAPKFIEKINAHLRQGDNFVTKIEFSRYSSPPEKPPAAAKPAPEVELTADEIADCESQTATINDAERRQIVLQALLSHAKAEKSKLARHWHKCKLCELLCPPSEIICDICKVRERERMHNSIRRIFHDAPWTPFREVQATVSAEFAHLPNECTLDAIESARMELIAHTAARISYGDTSSDAAKFLVMLIRQLPLNMLTPALISHTLSQFRFNLAPPPRMYHFLKLPKVCIKVIRRRNWELQRDD